MENTGTPYRPKQFRKRNAVLMYLRQSKTHPSAEEVYRGLQQHYTDISLATVYRNLALFKEQGLIVSLGTVNGIERFDGRVDPHIHFTCTRCGKVEDVEDLPLPENLSLQAEERLQCQVENLQLTLWGICCDCLQQEAH